MTTSGATTATGANTAPTPVFSSELAPRELLLCAFGNGDALPGGVQPAGDDGPDGHDAEDREEGQLPGRIDQVGRIMTGVCVLIGTASEAERIGLEPLPGHRVVDPVRGEIQPDGRQEAQPGEHGFDPNRRGGEGSAGRVGQMWPTKCVVVARFSERTVGPNQADLVAGRVMEAEEGFARDMERERRTSPRVRRDLPRRRSGDVLLEERGAGVPEPDASGPTR